MCLTLHDYQPKASRELWPNTLEKQSDHKSEIYNRLTETKKKETQV